MSNTISNRKVLPSGPDGAELLFIGEAPGYEEDVALTPFVGDAGNELNRALSLVGISRDSVKVMNLCNYRPVNNNFDYLIGTPQLQEGINDIKHYITRFKDKLKFVVLLGAKPIEFLGRKSGKGLVEKWRSSVFQLDGVRYYSTYHPAAIYRNRALYPIFTFDIRKLHGYLRNGYTAPTHEFTINPKGYELEESLREIESKDRITVDIEGVKESTRILCCGFGLSKSRAICLVNDSYAGLSVSFASSLVRILENPKIEKIFQNGFGYDIEVFRLNGINVVNYSFDTMIAAHVLDPEMPYGLDFLTTLYTDEPYYKDKGKSSIPDDDKGWGGKIEAEKDILYDYNCTDTIVDYEIAQKQMDELTERKLWKTYNYKHSLIPLGQALSRPGMLIDTERREFLRLAVKEKWRYYQSALNTLAGFNVNVKSGTDMKKLLIDNFGLPKRIDRSSGNITFDEDAIVSYLNVCQDKINSLKTEKSIEEWQFRLAVCKIILLIRGYRQLLSNYINIKYSDDNRIRSVYNLSAATETGRGSSHKWVDGTGNNAQTWPREVLELDDDEVKKIIEKLHPMVAINA